MSKKVMAVAMGAALALTLAACGEQPTSPQASSVRPEFSKAITGNGMPSGAHYNLNIIGVPKGKTADMDATSGNGIGNRIFVDLVGGDSASVLNGTDFGTLNKRDKIFLCESGVGADCLDVTDFAVLDANATDQDGGLFALPQDSTHSYTIYARELGQPGGGASQATCAVDPTTNDVYCSTENAIYFRDTGKPKTQNVTDDLTTLTITVTGDALATCLGVSTGDTVTVNLFNGCFENYFWNYDNHGLRVLQLRFYQNS